MGKIQAAVEKKITDNPFQLSTYASDFVFNPVVGGSSFRIDEPVEVAEAGTGFMLIPQTTFNIYENAYPELNYKPDHARTAHFDGSKDIMAYFDCGIDPETRRYLSEDYFFCWNTRKIGLSVYMCPWIKLNHVGTYIFRGDMSSIAKLGASPTSTKKSNPKNYKKKKLGIRP